jgi:hypothetical protein
MLSHLKLFLKSVTTFPDTRNGIEAVETGSASRYGSGTKKMMRLFATPGSGSAALLLKITYVNNMSTLYMSNLTLSGYRENPMY